MKENYLKNYGKLAKHCMKGKVSLTLATLVSLLITGQVALGAMDTTNLSGGETHNVLSREDYSGTGFNVSSGENKIIFNNSGASVVVRSNHHNNYHDDDATGVNITGENKLTIKYQENLNSLQKNNFNVSAKDTATGIKGEISGNYDLTNEVDFLVHSDEGNSHGINIFTTGKEEQSHINNSGNMDISGGNLHPDFTQNSTGIETYVMENDRKDSVNNSGTITVHSATGRYSEATGMKTTTEGNNNKGLVKNTGVIVVDSNTKTSTNSNDKFFIGVKDYADANAISNAYANGIDSRVEGNSNLVSITNERYESITATATANASANANLDLSAYTDQVTQDKHLLSLATLAYDNAKNWDYLIFLKPFKSAQDKAQATLNSANKALDQAKAEAKVADIYASAFASADARGIDADIEGDSNIVTITNKGIISADAKAHAKAYAYSDRSSSNEKTYAAGIDMDVDGNNTNTTITNEITGTITATAEDKTYGIAIDMSGNENNTSITNNGGIDLTSTNSDATGIYTKYDVADIDDQTASTTNNNTVSITNSQKASIKVNGAETAIGMGTEIHNGLDNAVTMGNAGNIDVDATGKDKDAKATGIYAYLDIDNTPLVEGSDKKISSTILTNLGTITADSYGDATGIYAEVMGNNTVTDINNSGNMTITSTGSDSYGIEASINGNKTNVAITNGVEGDNTDITTKELKEDINLTEKITVTAKNKAYGIMADMSGNENNTSITNNGGIDLTSTNNDATGIYTKYDVADIDDQTASTTNNNTVSITNSQKASIKVNGAETAIGMGTEIHNGLDNAVTMGNAGNIDVDATGKDKDTKTTGIYAYLDIDNTPLVEGSDKKISSTILTNSGTITADSYGDATGIYAEVMGNNTVTDINNSGNMTMTSTGSDSYGIEASLSGDHSIHSISHAGDITATINVAERTKEQNQQYTIGIETQLSGDDITAEVTNSGRIKALVTAKGETKTETFAVGMNSGLTAEKEFGGSKISNSTLTMTNTLGGEITAMGSSTGVGMVVGIEGTNNNITVTNIGDISAQGKITSGQLAFVDNTYEDEAEPGIAPVAIATNLTMENSGTMTSKAMMYATGMVEQLYGEDITSNMINSGTIIATTVVDKERSAMEQSSAIGMSTYLPMDKGFAIVKNSELKLTNFEGGSISVSAKNAAGILAAIDGEENEVTINNAGDITAVGKNTVGISAKLNWPVKKDIHLNALVMKDPEMVGTNLNEKEKKSSLIVTNSGIIKADAVDKYVVNDSKADANGIDSILNENTSELIISNSGEIGSHSVADSDVDLDDTFVLGSNNYEDANANADANASGINTEVEGDWNVVNITNEAEGSIDATATATANAEVDLDTSILNTYASQVTQAEEEVQKAEKNVQKAKNGSIDENGHTVIDEVAVTTAEKNLTEAKVQVEQATAVYEKSTAEAKATDIYATAHAYSTVKGIYADIDGDDNTVTVSNKGEISVEAKTDANTSIDGEKGSNSSKTYAAGMAGQISGRDNKLGMTNSGTIEAKTTEEKGYAVGMSTGSIMNGPFMATKSKVPEMYNNYISLINTETGLIKVSSDMAVGIEGGVFGGSSDLNVTNSGIGENAGIEVTGKYRATGILASISEDQRVQEDGSVEETLTVTNIGDIDAIAKERASGIEVLAEGRNFETAVSNSGNINSESEQYAAGMVGHIYGRDNKLGMTNSGTVEAKTTEEKGYAVGMSTGSIMNGPFMATKSKVPEMYNNDISLINTETGLIKVSSDMAVGIESRTFGGSYDLNVTNSGIGENAGIEVTSKYRAIGILASISEDENRRIQENSSIEETLTVTNIGDIDAIAKERASGIEVLAEGRNFETAVSNSGNINSESERNAIGMAGHIHGQDLKLGMTNSGKIDETADYKAIGILATTESRDIEDTFSKINLTNNKGGIINITVGSSDNNPTPVLAKEKYSNFKDATYGMYAKGTNSNISLNNHGNININNLGSESTAVGMSALMITGQDKDKDKGSIESPNVDVNNNGTIRINNAGGTSIGMFSEIDIYNKSLSNKAPKTKLNNSGDIILKGDTSAGMLTLSGDATNSGRVGIVGNKSYGMLSGYEFEVGGDLINNGSITAVGNNSYGMKSSIGDITNSKEITVIGDNSIGITSSIGNITSSGKIVATGINSYGIYADTADVRIDNTNSIINATGKDSAGVKIDSKAQFTNTGTIFASNGAVGVDMSDADTTDFTNTGEIKSEGTAVLMNLGANSRVILQGEKSFVTGLVNGGGGENSVVLKDNANIQFETKNISIISVESGESHIVDGTTVALNTAVNPSKKIIPEEGTTLVIDEGATVNININKNQETSRLDAETIDVDGKILIDTSFLDMNRATVYHFEHVFTGDVTDESWNNILVDSYTWGTSEGSLIIKKSDYASLTNIGELKGVAEVLETNKLSSKFETVLDELDKTTTKTEYEEALDEISGNMYVSFPAITLQTTKIFEKNIKNFINLDSESEIQQHINIIGENGDFSKNDKNEGFKYQSIGFIGATEKNFSKKNTIGLSYGYVDTDADFEDAANNSADIKTAHAGIYQEYQGEIWQLATRAAYEYNNIDAKRIVDFHALDYRMNSNFDVNSISIGTELSANYQVGHWEFKPLAGITYSHINQDEIKEDGGESINITIGSETYASIRSELGFRIDRKLSFGSIYGQAGWNHEFGDVYDNISASLQGAPSDSYGIYGLQDMDDTYTAGAGIMIGDKEGLSCNIRYSFSGNADFKEHTVSTGLVYTF